MSLRLARLAILVSVAASATAVAQQAPRYTAPRTEYNQPDFQGIWGTEFLTMMERPPAAQSLVATPEQARALVAGIRAGLPVLVDPDVFVYNISQLAMVKGEYRTSMIVEPKDGRIPFTSAGLAIAGQVSARNNQKFDNPEERPLAERCLENLAYAPIRTVPVFLPRQIVQTRDYLVISPEDSSGPRIIRLQGGHLPDAVRSIGGDSVGHWEGDTLVVEVTHLRADDPARTLPGRPLVLSRQTKITERFTRVSATELFYQFTIEDPALYTQAWSGEFSLTRHDGRVYEYACHEGNYSLPNALRGGRAQDNVADTKQAPR